MDCVVVGWDTTSTGLMLEPWVFFDSIMNSFLNILCQYSTYYEPGLFLCETVFFCVEGLNDSLVSLKTPCELLHYSWGWLLTGGRNVCDMHFHCLSRLPLSLSASSTAILLTFLSKSVPSALWQKQERRKERDRRNPTAELTDWLTWLWITINIFSLLRLKISINLSREKR